MNNKKRIADEEWHEDTDDEGSNSDAEDTDEDDLIDVLVEVVNTFLKELNSMISSLKGNTTIQPIPALHSILASLSQFLNRLLLALQ